MFSRISQQTADLAWAVQYRNRAAQKIKIRRRSIRDYPKEISDQHSEHHQESDRRQYSGGYRERVTRYQEHGQPEYGQQEHGQQEHG
jgi:hypothetical protein